MTSPTRDRRATGFFLGFLVVALLIAGGLSYFASGDPDGLDTVTLSGCELSADGEPEAGTCIATSAEDHALDGDRTRGEALRPLGVLPPRLSRHPLPPPRHLLAPRVGAPLQPPPLVERADLGRPVHPRHRRHL